MRVMGFEEFDELVDSVFALEEKRKLFQKSRKLFIFIKNNQFTSLSCWSRILRSTYPPFCSSSPTTAM